VIRRLALGVVAAALAVSLAGCVSNAPIPTPSPAAITGIWRHGSDILRINADGTFSLANVPLGVVKQSAVALGAQPSGPNESVTGKWSIGSGGTDAGGAPGVQLDFVQPRKLGPDYGMTLVVSGDVPPELYVFLGHPDSATKYTFTRGK
jgi:hypothetical protein